MYADQPYCYDIIKHNTGTNHKETVTNVPVIDTTGSELRTDTTEPEISIATTGRYIDTDATQRDISTDTPGRDNGMEDNKHQFLISIISLVLAGSAMIAFAVLALIYCR